MDYVDFNRPKGGGIPHNPSEQGSQRVTDATTLYKAQKNARTHRPHRPAEPPPAHATPPPSRRPAARPHQGDAWLWPPLSRPRSGLVREAQRVSLTLALTTAMGYHDLIRKQSTQLTHGKKLSHWKLVNAYDLTSAPIIKGKSNCSAQFGRKPGLASEPATGFILANLVPQGNPSDPSYVLPLLDKVQQAIERSQTGPQRQIHSVAGDRGLNDAAVRQALPTRGILTVGIPKTVESIKTSPRAHDVFHILTEAALHRKRTPYQVHLACGSGYSRPVVESHIASLLSRGAGHMRYKGLEGAVLQQGMTVMDHNGAVIVRIRQQQLSKRAQKFRRLLGLKLPTVNEINRPKN